MQSASVVHSVPMQKPVVQMSPAGQLTPHCPQFWGSLWRSVHVVRHSVPLHDTTHVPPMHTWPMAQLASVVHAMAEHAPAVHVSPAAQMEPHAPQLFGSLWVSMHVPLHTTPLHPATHTPPMHVWPMAQSVSVVQPEDVVHSPPTHT
jgi:hypothetical protein